MQRVPHSFVSEPAYNKVCSLVHIAREEFRNAGAVTPTTVAAIEAAFAAMDDDWDTTPTIAVAERCLVRIQELMAAFSSNDRAKLELAFSLAMAQIHMEPLDYSDDDEYDLFDEHDHLDKERAAVDDYLDRFDP